MAMKLPEGFIHVDTYMLDGDEACKFGGQVRGPGGMILLAKAVTQHEMERDLEYKSWRVHNWLACTPLERLRSMHDRSKLPYGCGGERDMLVALTEVLTTLDERTRPVLAASSGKLEHKCQKCNTVFEIIRHHARIVDGHRYLQAGSGKNMVYKGDMNREYALCPHCGFMEHQWSAEARDQTPPDMPKEEGEV